MIVTNGQLATTLKHVQRTHLNDFRSLDAVQGWREITTVIASNTETEELSWFGDVPQLTDTTNDEVSIGGASPYDYALKNRVYQTAISFKREWWEDDTLGHGAVLIQRLASRVQQHRGKRAMELFEGSDLAFDGTAFFANRTGGQGQSGAINNTISVNVTDTSAPTVQEVSDMTDDVFTRMASFKDDQGEPLGYYPDTFVVPPQLYGPIYRGLTQGMSGSGTSEPLPPPGPRGIVQAGAYKIMVNYHLTSSAVIYPLCTMNEVKPIVMIERQQPTVGGIVDVNSDWWLIKRKIPYIAYDRFRFGWGDFRTGIKVTFT